jgi:hypothetical protein
MYFLNFEIMVLVLAATFIFILLTTAVGRSSGKRNSGQVIATIMKTHRYTSGSQSIYGQQE